MNTRKILWVDDRISGLSSWIALLRDRGFQVLEADSTRSALAIAERSHVDICLVDLNMPEPDGIECLERLRDLLPEARLAALSSYHYLDSYKTRLRALPFAVEVLDKDHPSAFNNQHEDVFLESILRLERDGVTNTIQSFERMIDDGNIGDPFTISLDDFDRLPLALKDRYRLKAGKKASNSIRKAFSSGAIWVVFCGDKQTIMAQAISPNEIKSDRQLREFAVAQGKPVYQFFSKTTVDDLWSHCGTSAGSRYYPTVTIEFGRSSICVHFDTGAPMTFFSYEELLRLEAITPTQDFGLAWRHGDPEPYWAKGLDVEVELRDQANGGTETVHIRGQIVRDWASTSYALHCNSSCEAAENRSIVGRLCPNRQALVGRNLLIENALIMTLDGTGKKTSIRRIPRHLEA